MYQRRNHHLVALHEEARHHQAHDQVLADDGLERRAAHFGLGRRAARGGPPGGERIGKLHLGACAATGVGGDIGGPECRIGEGLAHLGLHQPLGFQLRQARRRTQLRQAHAALAGIPLEPVFQGSGRVDVVPFPREEGVHNVLGGIGADAVDGLVHHAQAEFGARRGLAVGGGGFDAVLGGLAGLILRLVGGQLHVQLVLHRRDPDVLRALVVVAVAHVAGHHDDAGFVVHRDRNVVRHGGVLRPQHFVLAQVAAFHGNQHGGARRAGQDHPFRNPRADVQKLFRTFQKIHNFFQFFFRFFASGHIRAPLERGRNPERAS